MTATPKSITVWRHPRPADVAGRCIGGATDVRVDRRRAKRLAHRIRTHARRSGTPRCVVTSGLQRASAVGRILAAWGWRHRIDARLAELDFGTWDGRTWDEIGAAPVGRWTDDFPHHAPGGGESVAALLARCGDFLADRSLPAGVSVVGHAGWISAALWLQSVAGQPPTAADWPAAIGYGRCATLAANFLSHPDWFELASPSIRIKTGAAE